MSFVNYLIFRGRVSGVSGFRPRSLIPLPPSNYKDCQKLFRLKLNYPLAETVPDFDKCYICLWRPNLFDGFSTMLE